MSLLIFLPSVESVSSPIRLYVLAYLNPTIDRFGGRVQVFRAPPRDAIQYGEFLRHHPFHIDFITDHKLVLSYIHGFM